MNITASQFSKVSSHHGLDLKTDDECKDEPDLHHDGHVHDECCHCISSSEELLLAVRRRFFVPAPVAAAMDEKALIWWCQFTQRPIQNKCTQMLCQWMSHYFGSDFVAQRGVLHELHQFVDSIFQCRSQCDDGWYEALTALLTSAIESAYQAAAEKERFRKEADPKQAASGRNELLSDDVVVAAKEENVDKVDDVEALDALLSIDYALRKKGKGQQQRPAVGPRGRRVLYEHSARKLAEQITLRDWSGFESIHLREFLDKVWKSQSVETPNLQRMVRRFNRLHKWAILCIVSAHDLEDRVLALGHFLNVGLRLAEMGNFFSLMAVYGAVDSVTVSRLKHCWLRLDRHHKATKRKLAAICSPSNNFKKLRQMTRDSFSAHRPTIPYIGVFLSDLTFVNEGAAKLVEGFINFKRFQRFTERCKIIECFQRTPFCQWTQTVLYQQIQGDIDVFNDRLHESAERLLVGAAVKRDEKSATKAEREKVSAMKAEQMERRGGRKRRKSGK